MTPPEPDAKYTPTYRRVLAVASSIPAGMGLALPLGSVLAALLLIPSRRPVNRPPMAVHIAWAGFATAGVLVVSAVSNRTNLPMSNISNAVAVAVFVLAFAKVTANIGEAAFLLCWLTLTNTVFITLAGPLNTQGSIAVLWKYGIAYPATALVLYVLAVRFGRYYTSAVALGLVGGWSMLLDYRSVAVVAFISAAIIVSKGTTSSKAALRTLILGGAAAITLVITVPQLIESGYLGESAQLRSLEQTDEGAPLILGGRAESPLSAAAIIDKPLLGWGDQQTIDSDTISHGAEIAQALGMGSTSNFIPIWIRPGGIVSLHSIALSTWVEGGILATAFPLMLIVLFGSAILRSSGRYAPLVVFTSLGSIWNLLFSPWANSQGVLMAAYAVLAAWAVTDARTTGEGIDLNPKQASGKPALMVPKYYSKPNTATSR